jgi:predicted peptidase
MYRPADWLRRTPAIVLAAAFIASCSVSAGTPSVSAPGPTTTLGSEATATPSATQQFPADLLTPKYAGETDSPLGYYEYLPPDYEDAGDSPLLVFLHGFGGNGDGSEGELFLALETGIPGMIHDGQWSLELPFVVLSPQHDTPVDPETVPEEDFFQVECNWEPDVAAFIDYALSTYEVDPDRVYLTGLSCGGYGAWMYLAEHGGSQIAAMVPIAGPADEAWEKSGCDLGVVPIWAFHGDADDVVPATTATEPMESLAECPAPPQREATMTVYPGVDHDSWTPTYDLSAGHDIYAWMLEHTLSE